VPIRKRRQQAIEKAEQDRLIDLVPDHLRDRIGKPSALSEALKCSLAAPFGHQFDEHGQPFVPAERFNKIREAGRDGATANIDNANKRAEALRRQYGESWRAGNKVSIAKEQGITVKTVERYLRRAPREIPDKSE